MIKNIVHYFIIAMLMISIVGVQMSAANADEIGISHIDELATRWFYGTITDSTFINKTYNLFWEEEQKILDEFMYQLSELMELISGKDIYYIPYDNVWETFSKASYICWLDYKYGKYAGAWYYYQELLDYTRNSVIDDVDLTSTKDAIIAVYG